MTNYTTATHRPIHLIATEILEELLQLRVPISDYLGATLGPLLRVEDLSEDFGHASAASTANYCVGALADEPGWTGATADLLTRELHNSVAQFYGEDVDDFGPDWWV